MLVTKRSAIYSSISYIFIIGVVRGGWGVGGTSSISYIQNMRSQGVRLHPYHIFRIYDMDEAPPPDYAYNEYMK